MREEKLIDHSPNDADGPWLLNLWSMLGHHFTSVTLATLSPSPLNPPIESQGDLSNTGNRAKVPSDYVIARIYTILKHL